MPVSVTHAQAIKEKLIFRSKPSNLLYVAEAHGSMPQHKMGHLACFIGGLFGLASKNAPSEDLSKWYLEVCGCRAAS